MKKEIWLYMSHMNAHLPMPSDGDLDPVVSMIPPVIKSDFKRNGAIKKSDSCKITVYGFSSMVGTDMTLWMETYLPGEYVLK